MIKGWVGKDGWDDTWKLFSDIKVYETKGKKIEWDTTNWPPVPVVILTAAEYKELLERAEK